MDRLLIVLIGIMLVFSLLTWGLGQVFRSNRIYKFIPAFVASLAGIINIYIARTSTGGFEDLARGILAVMLLTGALSGFVTGLALDKVIPFFRNRNTH